MDYTFPASNPSSCASSSGGATTTTATGEPRKEKTKKNGGTNKKSKGAVKLSTDPQSVAARERRHRISERFRILQSLVPGGTKMDTVSMLDEAIHYVKFLKTQIWLHQTMINFVDYDHDSAAAVSSGVPFDQIAGGEYDYNYNNMGFFYPQNDGVKMEEPFLPQLDSNNNNNVNYFSSEQNQFLCSSYDAYMNNY